MGKNEAHINKVNAITKEIQELRQNVQSSFNNREMSLVATKLQEAEFWAKEFVAKLSEE